MKKLISLIAVFTAFFSVNANAGVELGYKFLNMDTEAFYRIGDDGVKSNYESDLHVVEFDYEHPVGKFLFIVGYDASISDAGSKFESVYLANNVSENPQQVDYSRWNVGFGQRVYDGMGKYKVEVYGQYVDTDLSQASSKLSDIGVNLATEYRMYLEKVFLGFEVSGQIMRTSYESSLHGVSTDIATTSVGIGFEPYIGYAFTPNLDVMISYIFNHQESVYNDEDDEDENIRFEDITQDFKGVTAMLEYRF